MSSSSARALALDVVARVIDGGAYSNRLLPVALDRSALDARDRAFAMALAFGTLRRRLALDAAVTKAAGRPIERITTPARHALRLGAYQLIDMQIPAHAAVSATVDLVGGRERGFVNAVLRAIASDPPGPAPGSSAEALALRTGLAPWAVTELERLVGDDTEVAATALASQASLCLRVIGGVDRVPAVLEEIAAAGLEATVGSVDPACVLVPGGDPRTLAAFREGRVTVQDQASVFVGRLVDAGAGDRIADVCAAPGGKALHLAELVGPRGRVVAADRSPGRVGLIRTSAARLGRKPWLVVHDATAPPFRGGFDAVLVDAPCSGIGSARRRPELLWRVEQRAVSPLAARQLAIVTAAADLVRPGGRLVYAVCTYTRAETDAVCDALVRTRADLEPMPTLGPDGMTERHRLWPHRHGTDGMFVAAFGRRTPGDGR